MKLSTSKTAGTRPMKETPPHTFARSRGQGRLSAVIGWHGRSGAEHEVEQRRAKVKEWNQRRRAARSDVRQSSRSVDVTLRRLSRLLGLRSLARTIEGFDRLVMDWADRWILGIEVELRWFNLLKQPATAVAN